MMHEEMSSMFHDTPSLTGLVRCNKAASPLEYMSAAALIGGVVFIACAVLGVTPTRFYNYLVMVVF